jgi:arylsulfatase A-like enzyme
VPPAARPAGDAPPARPSGPLNVLLITIDAFRADHAPWHGYARPVAPNLTALAERSVVYTRAYSISSYTAMSMGGMLAGRYPSELRRSGSFFSHHPPEVLFFPELLQEAGVRTLAGHAHFYFGDKSGFRQGFDDYRLVAGIGVDHLTDRSVTSPAHLALATEMLAAPALAERPFFAWFHFMDPHDLYEIHDGFPSFGKKSRDRYDGEILFTDHYVGKLLEMARRQPWWARTAVIVSADHGEAFGEHKQSRHGFELWENLVRVPLLLHVPGVAPRRIDTPRSHIDLAPTILELLGVPAHASFHGRSLLAEARGEAEPEPRDVLVDLPRTSDNDRRRALVFDRHKILSFGDDFRFELYDVVTDPGETRDLRKSRPDVYDAMRARYRKRVESIVDVCPERRNNLKNRVAGRPC